MFKLRILQGAPKVLAAKTSAPSTHVPREDILCGKDPIRWARRAHVRKRGAVVEEHLALFTYCCPPVNFCSCCCGSWMYNTECVIARQEIDLTTHSYGDPDTV